MNTQSKVEDSEDFHEGVLAELSGEQIKKLRRRALLRRFWRGALYYWKERGSRAAWLLTSGLLVIILLGLATSYGMNVWNRAIFDALQKHDGPSVLQLSLLYVLLLAASVAVAI